MLQVAVLSPLQHTNAVRDGGKALLWSGDSKLDHGCSLIGAKLEGVALVGHNGAKLHGKMASLAGLDEWKIPELKGNIVSTTEVLIDADVFLGTSLTVLELEEGILGVSTTLLGLEGKLLNGVLLIICKMSAEIISESLWIYHHSCHGA